MEWETEVVIDYLLKNPNLLSGYHIRAMTDRDLRKAVYEIALEKVFNPFAEELLLYTLEGVEWEVVLEKLLEEDEKSP